MLIACLADYEDKLRADFQQFYNLNIDDLGNSLSINHAAALCEELPSSSRVVKAINPRAAWDEEKQLLAMIEYWAHVNVWAQSKDAKYKRNKPKLIEPKNKEKQKDIVSYSSNELDEILKRKRG